MTTSNFARSSKLPDAVAISRGIPGYFKGRRYEPLAPDRAILKLAAMVFDRMYAEHLSTLDPHEVAKALGPDAVLLCWETFNVKCHRRMVAEWLEAALHIEIPELGHERAESIAYKDQILKPEKTKNSGHLFLL